MITAGWQICCQWKDGSTSWEKLFELKEFHPVQTAEFAVAQGIDHEPDLTGGLSMCSRKETELLPTPDSSKQDT